MILFSLFFSVVPYQPKKKSDTRSAIDAYNEIIPPMDYSFCRIENIAGNELDTALRFCQWVNDDLVSSVDSRVYL